MSNMLIIIISVIFSAFFSGMEIAFISSNKLRIELEKKQKIFPYKIINTFIKNPGKYIATMLIGNNIALVIYGILMAILLKPIILIFTTNEISIFTIQTIISTIIILITAEFLPKVFFRINPNFLLNIFSIPVLFFYILFYPITTLINNLSNFLLNKILGVKTSNESKKNVFGKIDLDHLVNESHDQQKKHSNIDPEIKIFQNALDFSSIKLRDCKIPRTDIVAIDANESIDTLKQKFIETGLSRILVYKNSIDNIIGYLNSSELFKNPKVIKSKLVKVPIVTETMPANKLLKLFLKESKSIAVVVDEFGGTSGLVTIEDIIEEIFGEIEDEHDTIELEERKISETEYIFSGRLEIDYINEKYFLNIPEKDDYETIAGFILFHHESIPKPNDRIIIKNISFKILKADRSKIELVNLKITNE